MINVTIFKDSADQFIGFKFSGHAGFDVSGRDIVCSAVSVLVINTVNSIEKFTDDDFVCDTDEKSGMIEFHLNGKLSNESKILMNSMVLGIQGIKEDNEKYIKIKFKEV